MQLVAYRHTSVSMTTNITGWIGLISLDGSVSASYQSVWFLLSSESKENDNHIRNIEILIQKYVLHVNILKVVAPGEQICKQPEDFFPNQNMF